MLGHGCDVAGRTARRDHHGVRECRFSGEIYGPKVDEFVLSMNRAAESAAPQAKQIFLDAIGKMSFDDARKI